MRAESEHGKEGDDVRSDKMDSKHYEQVLNIEIFKNNLWNFGVNEFVQILRSNDIWQTLLQSYKGSAK